MNRGRLWDQDAKFRGDEKDFLFIHLFITILTVIWPAIVAARARLKDEACHYCCSPRDHVEVSQHPRGQAWDFAKEKKAENFWKNG